MQYEGTFEILQKINKRPKPFEFYTTPLLWKDAYLSEQMLELHLNPDAELASRNKIFIQESVDWITEHFNISSHSKICDFGCGPGLYTTPFAEKGAEVTGIDFSERSINYAKQTAIKKNLSINYQLQDYLDFTTNERFNLITMIYCDFCVLNTNQRKKLLEKFYDLLESDGAILLDVFSQQQFNATNEKTTCEHSLGGDFWSANPYFTFLNTFKYNEEKLLLDKWTILEKEKTREIYNWLQCYCLESLKKEFKESGFNIIEHYSNVSGAPYSPDSSEIAVVATKA